MLVVASRPQTSPSPKSGPTSVLSDLLLTPSRGYVKEQFHLSHVVGRMSIFAMSACKGKLSPMQELDL